MRIAPRPLVLVSLTPSPALSLPFVPLPPLPPAHCRPHGDAEAYKECLDAYLEGSIAGGPDLRARLLEREARDHRDSDDRRGGRAPPSLAPEAGVDLLSAAGDALRREFLLAARGARCLLAELGCVRFVGGPGAASSRGRRRRGQDAARAENLRNAAASLSPRHPGEGAPSSPATERRRDGGAGRTAPRPMPDALRSRTWSSPAAAAWSSPSSSGPNPVRLRRAVTSEEEADRYRELSARAAPAEGRLAVALGRFPLPDSVFAAAAGGARDDARDGVRDDGGDARHPAAVVGVVPGDGVVVAEGGAPPPHPPHPPSSPARDDDHGTSPRDEALQRIIPRAWLEEGSCGVGAIFPDPTSSSSSSSMDGTSMMDPTSSSLSSSSSSSMDGISMMDLSLWGARGSTTSNMIFDMISPQIVM